MYIIMTDLYSCICFFKQKTAYDVRISDSSSYVCSSDLKAFNARIEKAGHSIRQLTANLADAGKTAEAFGASLRKALSANVVQNLTKLGTAQSRAAALTVAANARVTASANNLKGVQVRAAAAAATAAANAAAAQTRAAAITTAANARVAASANNLQAAQARAAAAATAIASRAPRSVQVHAAQARSFLGTMRDVTIVAGMLPAALATAQMALTGWFSSVNKIGRASCRERVCQYV